MLVFDIETRPDIEKCEQVFDFQSELKHPGTFNPDSVKLGNLKDEKKIAEKIEAARQKHEEAIRSYDEDREAEYAKAWNQFVSTAALDPCCGRVAAIGFRSDRGYIIRMADLHSDANESEASMVQEFWELCKSLHKQGRKLVGHNIHEFDLPFLVVRSWALGIDVPPVFMPRNDRYWPDIFVDTRKKFLLGRYGKGSKSSLDWVCKTFELPDKDGQSGADFYRKLEEDPEAAEEYLKNDIDISYAVAERMGIA